MVQRMSVSNNTTLAAAPALVELPGYSVVRYAATQQREWDAFVREAKGATFLFARDYMDYHRDRFPDYSLMIYEGRQLAAVLPACVTAEGLVSSHGGLTYGGLLLARVARLGDTLAAFHACLRYLEQQQIATLLYRRIPAFYFNTPDDDIAYALFLLEARLYRRACATVIAQFDRLPYSTERRRQIRKAAALGVRVVAETSFQPFWEKILGPQLAGRYGVKPVHTLEEITHLAAHFPENIKQFSAYCGDEIVAGSTIYETPTVAHAQYGACSETGRETGAHAFLFDWLIERYRHKRFFNFGISNENEGRTLNQGLLHWKEGFGGRTAAHDFYEITTRNHSKLEPVIHSRAEVCQNASKSDAAG